jgi:hypothetical protein
VSLKSSTDPSRIHGSGLVSCGSSSTLNVSTGEDGVTNHIRYICSSFKHCQSAKPRRLSVPADSHCRASEEAMAVENS